MLKLNVKRWLAKTLVIFTALFAVQQVMAENTPYDLTKQVSDKLFSNIKASQSKIKQNPNYLKTIVRQDLMPYVHVKYAGSKILGQNYKTVTQEERDRYFAVLDKYIEQVYAQVLTMYSDQSIQIGKMKEESPTLAIVNVKVAQPNNQPPLNVDFYWYKNSKTGQWQVYDMTAGGASMVNTKQQEWSPIIRKQGLDALTAQLQKSADTPITLSK
ncbi:phospholipid-binding protein MlaC [Aggregatibacter kilianii]|jgi:conserved ABC-type transport system protein|uniref:phospholipid-binding protein MlaC n=1 Tax=Aggregatibacter kilianii TaxID=2025884 RepID=UPI000D65AA49|nr:phospholipid-binding protein MlaC [Aggregatibacter kilianii]RDE86810.1 phospholipid-binding protein MlaC [Aggregatibacter aphrophilus]RDE95516.1 phospholipid-binding protein MlaC [Aggregatibacter aphrophilus]RDE97480.1 phospholipid-binding protein MlaC [Aggregatibacter aphrophilus]RDF02301.1 phospholipid-binding protein MlaC [Aggregatibacter aphrophilus]